MKTKLDTTSHEVVGSQETRNLTIEANGKAFKELISGIYSDKAYAIARETMANCVDSHVQAGTPDRPFEIQVPSVINPAYMIRDFGVSMTHDTVMELYSTLFRSTKDDPDSDESNKFVGKFGLGSKSPFSYTDAFQLTAYLDGEARIYDIYFNGGVPQIALFARIDTDEPNGIKITFPVDPKDAQDFRRAIIRACEGLPVPPTFIGDQITLPVRRVKQQGSNWKLLDETASGAAEAKQGTVLYPLNFNAVIDCPSDLKLLFTLPFQFEFPIGELDVTTSRESLSYDEETSANIVKALQQAQGELREEWLKKFDACKTYHEFCNTWLKVRNDLNDDLFKMLQLFDVTWKGKSPRMIHSADTKDILIWSEKSEDDPDAPRIVTGRRHRFGDMQFCVIGSKIKAFYQPVPRFKEEDVNIHAGKAGVYVVLEDTTIRPRYTHQRLEILKNKKVFKGEVEVLWVRHAADPTFALKRLQAALGRMPMIVIHLKDVPYTPERLPRLASGEVNANYRVPRGYSWDNPGDAPLPEDAYFVELHRDEVIGVNLRVSLLLDIHKKMIELGAEDMPVIGIQKSHARLIKQNPQWVPFTTAAAEVLKETLTVEALFPHALAKEVDTPDIHRKVDKLRDLLSPPIFDKAASGTSLETILIKVDEFFDITNSADAAAAQTLRFLEDLGVMENEVHEEALEKARQFGAELADLAKDINSTYGLLKHLDIPKPLHNDPKVPNLMVARQNRMLRLPFYSWIKNTQKNETLRAAA
jgi:hypothetical protein